MPSAKVVNVRLSEKQLKELSKLTLSLGLDRSNLIRLAVARLISDEALRADRVQSHPSPKIS